MKALVVPAAGKLALEEVPEPRPGPYDALVSMECCGICNSTDWNLIRGRLSWAPPFPFILGHESCGRVIGVGERVRKFKIGDRVTRPVAYWPGSRPDMGVAMGGFAERGIVRDALAMAEDGDASLLGDYNADRQLVAPPGLTPVEVSLAISLSETASMLRHLPSLRERLVVVAGTGVAGLAFTLWAKFAGAYVVTLGRREERVALARRLGSDLPLNLEGVRDLAGFLRKQLPGPVDVLIEATGDVALAAGLEPLLGTHAIAAAYGAPPAGGCYDSRWTAYPVEEHQAFPWVASLLRERLVRADWFVTDQEPLEGVISALERVQSGRVFKGFINLDGKA